jgi:hypothetical protein
MSPEKIVLALWLILVRFHNSDGYCSFLMTRI